MAAIIILSIIILLAVLYLFVLVFPGIKRNRKIPSELLVNFAHRGLHNGEAPENSLAAFGRAVEAGFGIELDVQLSLDGEVMVFHDYTLKRLTDDERKLSDLTSEELKKLSLLGTDEKIPTLKEVLSQVDGRVPLLVELKGEKTDTSLCPKVDEILSGYSGKYLIESFNPALLGWFRKNHSEIYRGILTTKVCKERGSTVLNILLDSLILNVIARPDFVAYDKQYKKFSVRICEKLFGLPSFAWTVRNKEERDLLESGTPIIFEGFIPE